MSIRRIVYLNRVAILLTVDDWKTVCATTMTIWENVGFGLSANESARHGCHDERFEDIAQLLVRRVHVILLFIRLPLFPVMAEYSVLLFVTQGTGTAIKIPASLTTEHFVDSVSC